MATATVKGILHLYVPSLNYENGKRSYHFATSKLVHEDFAVVKECSFETEIPDDFDPVPAQLNALDEQEKRARLKLAEELASINDRRSKLQALCYDAPVTVGVFDEVF